MKAENQSWSNTGYQPVYQTERNGITESIHFGAAAVVSPDGRLYASLGDPGTATFLRSSAKPLQTIRLVELGGLTKFNLTEGELAVTCASHSGTDQHLRTIASLQEKIGITEADLLCCTHLPFDKASQAKLKDQGLSPTPNYHNCSGKHSGMLAQAVLLGASKEEYTEIDHPVQQGILQVICDMSGLTQDQIAVGRDGCSVPTFAMPLYNAACAWARLMDPSDLPAARAAACRRITAAMGDHPFLVAGPGRFDTRLMKASAGKLVAKAGAEAFQAIGIYPGAIAPGSPALGIAIKIADGDQGKRARRAVTLEILRQLGVLSTQELGGLTDLGPVQTYRNQCEIAIGEGKPCFQLQYS
ncbi:MAG: asparaginase [Anaerolineales bacterium]